LETRLHPESIYTLTYAWRVKRLLFVQILCWDLTAPFLSFGLRLALIVTALANPRLVVTTILPSWIVLMLVRYIFVPLRAGGSFPVCSSTCSSTSSACTGSTSGPCSRSGTRAG
jgi:hypothetical protein